MAHLCFFKSLSANVKYDVSVSVSIKAKYIERLEAKIMD